MPVTLADRLPLSHVVTHLALSTRDEVIAYLAGRLADSGAIADADRLTADVLARERRLSTGVGQGLALPHARTRAVTGTVMALATLSTSVDWRALDGAPVEIVVLLAGPEADRAAHVQLLARVSRVLSGRDVRRQLARAETPHALLDVLARAEPPG